MMTRRLSLLNVIASTFLTIASLPYQNEAAAVAISSHQNEKTNIVDLSGSHTISRQLDTVSQSNATMGAHIDHSDEEEHEDRSHDGHESHSDENDSDEEEHEDHTSHDHSTHSTGHSEGEHKKPFGAVLLSTFLVNIVTLVGVLSFAPLAVKQKGSCCNARFWVTSSTPPDPEEGVTDNTGEEEFKDDKGETKDPQTSILRDIFVPSFACGALLATSFFLVFPEAIAFTQNAVVARQDSEGGHEDHADEGLEILPGTIVRFGVSLLAGYLFPLVLEELLPRRGSLGRDNDESEMPKSYYKLRLARSVLIGDAAHNFCDGIFIGVAFTTCSSAVAWTIVGVTIYHEVAQEVADYFLLTNQAGMSVCKALSLNFAAGISVILGGMITLGFDISDMAIGVILSFSGGVYMYIAASECLPRVDLAVKTRKDRLYSILFFLVGAVPIGLTLLKHEHCG